MIRLPVCLILLFGGNVFAAETQTPIAGKISELPRGLRYQAVDRRQPSQRPISEGVDLQIAELGRLAKLPLQFSPIEIGLALDMDRVLMSDDQSRFILMSTSRRIAAADQNKLFRVGDAVLWHTRLAEQDIAMLVVGYSDAQVAELKRQMDATYSASLQKSNTSRMPASETVTSGAVQIPLYTGPAGPKAISETPTYLSDLAAVARGCQVGLPVGLKNTIISPFVTARLVESNIKDAGTNPADYWKRSLADFNLAKKSLMEFGSNLAKAYNDFKLREAAGRAWKTVKTLGAHDGSANVAADAEFSCELIPGAFTLATGAAPLVNAKLNQIALRASVREAQAMTPAAIAARTRAETRVNGRADDSAPRVEMTAELPEVSIIEPKSRTVFRSNELAAAQAAERKLKAMSPSARAVQLKRDELAARQAPSNRVSQPVANQNEGAIPPGARELKARREALAAKQGETTSSQIAVGDVEHFDSNEALAMFYQLSDPKFPVNGVAMSSAEREALKAGKVPTEAVVHSWSPTARGQDGLDIPRPPADQALRMPVEMLSAKDQAALSGAPSGAVVHAFSPATRGTQVSGTAAAPADKALQMKVEPLLPVEKAQLAGPMSGNVIPLRDPDLSQMRMPVSEMTDLERAQLAADLRDSAKKPELLKRTADQNALQMPTAEMNQAEIIQLNGAAQTQAIRSAGERDRFLQETRSVVRERRRRANSRGNQEADYIPYSTTDAAIAAPSP